MQATTEPLPRVEHHEAAHEEAGFWRTYVFSTDHKMIGRQFLFLGLFMLVFSTIVVGFGNYLATK